MGEYGCREGGVGVGSVGVGRMGEWVRCVGVGG